MKLREAFGSLTHRKFGAQPHPATDAISRETHKKAAASGPIGLEQSHRDEAAKMVKDPETARRIKAGEDNDHPAVHAAVYRRPYKDGDALPPKPLLRRRY